MTAMTNQLPAQWTLSAFTDEAGTALDVQIEAAQKAGLRFVDLRSLDGYTIADFPLEQAAKARRKLDDAGLQVGMFGSPIGKTDIANDFAGEVERLRRIARLAPLLGGNAVRIFSFYNAHGAPKSQWEEVSLERLSKLRDEARTLGLVLFHENERHIFGDCSADVAKIAALRDDHLRTIFDFDNFNQGGEDVWTVWQLLHEVTDAFHLKDSTKELQHVPVGQGNGQVERILQDALRRGWRGPLTVEPHLSHSGAVAATGPGGTENEAYSKMPLATSFHLAVAEARRLLAGLSSG